MKKVKVSRSTTRQHFCCAVRNDDEDDNEIEALQVRLSISILSCFDFPYIYFSPKVEKAEQLVSFYRCVMCMLLLLDDQVFSYTFPPQRFGLVECL